MRQRVQCCGVHRLRPERLIQNKEWGFLVNSMGVLTKGLGVQGEGPREIGEIVDLAAKKSYQELCQHLLVTLQAVI